MKLKPNDILQSGNWGSQQNWIVETATSSSATLIELEWCEGNQPDCMRLTNKKLKANINNVGMPWTKKLGNFYPKEPVRPITIVPHNHEFQITEGVASTYRYHLSKVGEFTKSLCGKPTMLTQIPMAAWGVKSHLNEKWCAECLQRTGTMDMKTLLLNQAIWEDPKKREA